MERRARAAGLLVVLVVVAFVAVVVPPTVPESVGGEGPPEGEEVTVSGGELGVDAQALFEWTEAALDRDVPETPSVQITPVDESQLGAASDRRFLRLLVFEYPDADPGGGVVAFVSSFSTDVTINADRFPAVRNGTTGRSVEGLLVHEFTHVIQFQTPAFAGNRPVGFATTDDRRAWNAVAEGGGEFVADHYVEADRAREVGRTWNDPRTPAIYRLSRWPYYRGMVYLHDRLEAPADLWSAYEEPPRTTAAILRGERRGSAPPNRTVDVDVPGHEEVADDRLGAWFAEVALSRNVDPERAREVAEGWRWDRLVDLDPSNGSGTQRHVWVTEWRDADAADAFETAMTDYLDDRWQRADGIWRGIEAASVDLERPDDRSVALAVGPSAFLETVNVTVDGEGYAVVGADGPSTDAPDASSAGDAAGTASAGA